MDIVAAARAQMLGQLIDALSPSALQTAAAKSTPQLSAGQTVTAAVLGEAGGGKLLIRIGSQALAADINGADLPAGARAPGATLNLKVIAGGDTPRLTLSAFTPAPTDAASQAPTSRVVAQASITTGEAISAKPSTPAPTPLQAALRTAIAQAASRQGPAAPLYANLDAALSAPRTDIPPSVRTVATALLATRIDGEKPVTAEAVRLAVATAAGPPPATTGSTPATLDVRTLLATLKALLPKPGEAPVAQEGDALSRVTPPEPPRQNGGPNPQRPSGPTLPPNAETSVLTATLARETEQALERAKLHAYAGAADQRPTAIDSARLQPIAVELPIALGQQTTMLGFRVEQDRRHKRGSDGGPVDVWGIRFAIETDETGPVHAHLRLSGRSLSVSLWAEDNATRAAFAEALPRLEAALRDGALDVGELQVFAGRPHENRVAEAGRLLDVSS